MLRYAREQIAIDPFEHDDDREKLISGHMRRLRKTIITHFSRDKVHNLKLFISKPVLRKIEDGQPLEYLSEMRQVSCCLQSDTIGLSNRMFTRSRKHRANIELAQVGL